jgi:hypothetical protein
MPEMNALALIFSDKKLKSKQRSAAVAGALTADKISTGEVVNFAEDARDADKAACLEGLELFSRDKPSKCGKVVFDFAVLQLSSKAPAVKREAARLIANIAAFHKDELGDAVDALLKNTSHEGAVIRWSAALAIGEIVKSDARLRTGLLPRLRKLIEAEEKNSIRKIYQQAIKNS